MKRCPKCGGVNNPEAKFCTDCGTPLVAGVKARTASNAQAGARGVPGNAGLGAVRGNAGAGGGGVFSGDRVITIGRNTSNKVVINSPGISNFHCELRISNGKISIIDKNSTNGVFVNGKRVTSSVLKRGDTVLLGSKYTLAWETLLADTPVISLSDREISQARGEYVIGRDPDCDRVIDNLKVSRKHCRIFREGAIWFVEDLKSGNGTWLNGVKISGKMPIGLGDIITVGGTPFTLEYLTQAPKKAIGDIVINAKKLSFYGDADKKLIDDISLNITSGQFIGLIGPSGAGKTTLMYLLCGINKPRTGDVLINGESLVSYPDNFKGVFGYVPQDDILHRELQVIESLRYTGKLRMGETLQESEINDRASSVIYKLGIQEAAKVKIGSPEKKGISGGQRKKVNLGQELMTDPGILVLDEPTSGLDPRSDREVMTILRGLADSGRTVLLTTHNISNANFKFMTDVIVLAPGGKLAYYGPASEAAAYFGVDDVAEIFDVLAKKSPDEWKKKYLDSDYHGNYSGSTGEFATPKKKIRDGVGRGTGSLSQFFTLSSRYFTIKMRDSLNLLFLIMQAPIIAMIINLFFDDEGKVEALFILVISTIWLGTSNAVREIVNEKSIYKRERMVNLTIPAYISSKLLILFVFSIFQTAVLTAITASKLGFQNEIQLFGGLLLTSFTATVLGLLISSFSRTEAFALTLLPLVLIPMVVLGGLIKRFGKMEEWMKIISGFFASRWSFELGLISSVNNGTQAVGFSDNNAGMDILVITAMFLVFLGLLAYNLKRVDNKR